MKRLRVFCLILLILAVGSFGYCKVKQLRNTDKLGPVIQMEQKELELSVKDDQTVLMQGVTASDTKDGDVTDSIVIENVSDFLTDGRRIVTYAAFDQDGHVSKAERMITYRDYHQPRFQFESAMNFRTGEENFLEGVTVSDVLDGDLSGSIKFSQGSSVMTDVPGDYAVKMEVTNSAGDTAYLPITVTIYDSSSYSQTPQIALTEYVVYVKTGQKLKLEQYLDTVTLLGTEYRVVSGNDITADTIGSGKIKMSDKNVAYDKPGVYEAEYSMRSEEGKLGVTRLIIVVED